MAAGDVYVNIASVANNAYLTIQPAGSAEAVIHNIYYAGAVEFYRYDGTNNLKFDSDTATATFAREGLFLHVTNGSYARVKNVSGSTMLMGFDGVYTK